MLYTEFKVGLIIQRKVDESEKIQRGFVTHGVSNHCSIKCPIDWYVLWCGETEAIEYWGNLKQDTDEYASWDIYGHWSDFCCIPLKTVMTLNKF